MLTGVAAADDGSRRMTGMPSDLSILIVDDEKSNVVLLERLLEGIAEGAIHGITDAREVVPHVLEHSPVLLLLDYRMPHVDGIQLIEQVKALPQIPYLPIMMLTADMSAQTRTRALEAGATDFITKPLEPVETRLRVRNALRTSHLQRELADINRNLERRVQERTAELQLANDELRGLDQMRRDLLSLASHEMRTPLTIVRGFTEAWHRRGFPSDPVHSATQSAVVVRNVGRLERLIDNFLLASQIESGVVAPAPQAMSLDAALADVVGDLLHTGAAVSVDCPPDTDVVADPTLLHQIVLNLVTNALRYGAPPVEIRGWETDRATHVSVRDHGAGVPADFRERLFDRFSQASTGDKRTAVGTGLGLWISRRLAELHGGDIRYSDAYPCGALFEVRLPRPGRS